MNATKISPRLRPTKKCWYCLCMMNWISTRRKSPTTSPSTGLGGVNGSISGSCILSIRMFYVGYSFATCLLLLFFGLYTISELLIEILLQLLEMPLGYYGIVYCK